MPNNANNHSASLNGRVISNPKMIKAVNDSEGK